MNTPLAKEDVVEGWVVAPVHSHTGTIYILDMYGNYYRASIYIEDIVYDWTTYFDDVDVWMPLKAK